MKGHLPRGVDRKRSFLQPLLLDLEELNEVMVTIPCNTRESWSIALGARHVSTFHAFQPPILLLMAMVLSMPMSTAMAQDDSLQRGFLFVEGRYITPPYSFQEVQGQIFVNDTVLDVESLSAGKNGNKRREGRKERPEREPWRKLSQDLEDGSIVVLFAKQKAVTIRANGPARDFLSMLISPEGRKEGSHGDLKWWSSGMDGATWRQWLAEFKPSDDFLARAEAEIKRIDAIEEANLAANAAVDRLEASAYPLTLLGMILVAVSAGHLLWHRPARTSASEQGALSLETRRMVYRSLILVCALSALDLVWTMLVSQTGSMRELNPLGSRLIDDPQQLILFKFLLTSMSVGLLFALRRRWSAQVASWWICVICTLLTARWLVFNSMFVS